MLAVIEAAKVYNILEAKLKHATAPMTISMFLECVDLANAKHVQVRDCLRSLHSRNLVRKVPVVIPGTKERVGYEWAARPSFNPVMAKVMTSNEVVKQEEIRLRVNADKSVSIITPKLKITIELGL